MISSRYVIRIIVICLALLAMAAGWLLSRVARSQDRVAISVWRTHEKVMEDVVSRKMGSMQEFTGAAVFFSNLTGIEARVNGSYIGIHPTKHTKDDLESWKEWFKENRARLFWNPETQMVELSPHKED